MDIITLNPKKFKPIVKEQFKMDIFARAIEPYIEDSPKADKIIDYYCRTLYNYNPIDENEEPI